MSAAEVHHKVVGGVVNRAVGRQGDGVVKNSLAQPGGGQKPSEFLTSQAPFSSEKEGASGQKVEDLMTAQAGVRVGAEAAPREVTGVLAVTPKQEPPALPALVPIGTMGRPKVLTPELTEKLFMLLSVGFSRRQAAAYLGISHGTISNASAKDPEFAAELRRAEELTALQSEMTLMAAARQNWKAAAWYLTYKAKNPPPKSEEEKEEQHQAILADERRRAELQTIEMTNFEKSVKASREAGRTKQDDMLDELVAASKRLAKEYAK